MSIIAIRWAYSQPITNPVAKNVLVFLCTHDFPGNQCLFKISSICAATSYGRTAVKAALQELHADGYIDKDTRFDESGQQRTNSYIVKVPKEYVEKFCEEYELSTGRGREATTPQSSGDHPPSREATPYKNNNIKYNNKNSNWKKNKQDTYSNAKPGEMHSTVKEWAPGHPDYDALHSYAKLGQETTNKDDSNGRQHEQHEGRAT